jgi:PKD repeat protein
MKFFTLFTLVFGWISASSQNSCPVNMNFSMGDFTNWQCYIGNTTAIGCDSNIVNATPSAPLPDRHVILPPGTDTDYYGGFRITPPGITNVVKLGNENTGAQIERISYTFSVPNTASQYSITFLFAIVFAVPTHCPAQQPHFEARIYDVTTNQYIICSSAEYFSTAGAPGFQQSTRTSGIYYRPWTPFTTILDNYAGHILRLEFTNADCTVGGHFAYGYIAVPNNSSCNSAASGTALCPAASSTVTGPHGYQSYAWWNTSFTQNLGNTQILNLSPQPTSPTTYALDLVSYAGPACRDTIMVTVQPNTTIQTAAAGADTTLCGSGSGVTLGTASVSGLMYSWAPATGLSNPNIAQPVATPASTTTYVMTVSDPGSGCTKKDTVTVFVNAVPATFTINSSTQCLAGNNFQFTMSTVVGGSSYAWDFGDGSVSTQQNPAHVYAATGIYNVKAKVTNTNGCKDSTTRSVTVVSVAPTPVISLSGNQISSSASTGNQWYLNGTAIPGATGQIYTATVGGTYTVIVSLNNCTSPVSNAVTFVATGINALVAEWKLQLAPNPVNDKLIIKFGSGQKLNLEILDLMGRRLFLSENISTGFTVDLSRYLNGTYLVKLTNARTKKEVKKLVVKM